MIRFASPSGWLAACALLSLSPARDVAGAQREVASALMTVSELRVESQMAPLAVETPRPRFSWQLRSNVRGQRQTAYRIIVSPDSALVAAGKGDAWDSGRRAGDESTHVPYQGTGLQAGQAYYWSVRSWDANGRPTPWSRVASWRMGLPSAAEWGAARWIGLEQQPDSLRVVPGVDSPDERRVLGTRPVGMNALPQLRKSFSLQRAPVRATVFVSGLGHYELFLNGSKVGRHLMDPGWTDYADYALYTAYDVTRALRSGENVIGALLGNGFYNVPRERYRKLIVSYGYPKLILRLRLEHGDGRVEEVVSDTTWRATASPITFTSIFGGEDYDARRELTGWMTRGYDDRAWTRAMEVRGPPALRAQQAPPVIALDSFTSRRTTTPRPGVTVYDLGQNASGIPSIAVRGPAGAVVRITPGELLDDDGLVTQRASGGPHYYEFTLRGNGVERWRPRFTYYGFRYLQLETRPPSGSTTGSAALAVLEVKGIHLRSAAARAGTFETSHVLFQRIHRLIDWAIRSNLVSVFTDCPHREKLGWLEVPYLMGSSIRYNYDLSTLSRKVLDDVRAAQLPNGMIPDVAPEYTQFPGPFRDSPEWGSMGVIAPWDVYRWYGDRRVLEENYDAMRRYVGYLDTRAKDGIISYGLGDWYDLGPKPPGESQLTPPGVTATATYYRDLLVMSQSARELGRDEDASRYAARAAEVRAAFNARFLDSTRQRYATGSQTANAMALQLGIVPAEQRTAVWNNLLADLRAGGYALTAGDIGFSYLIQALHRGGASDVIHRMNDRTDVPGYGYQLAHGATSLTESWAALRFVSNNHDMLGHLMEWFYAGLGGVQLDSSAHAFRSFVVRPELVGDVASTRVTYESPYGRIVSAWHRSARRTALHVEVPVGTTAVVYLPPGDASRATEGGLPLRRTLGVELLEAEQGRQKVRLGAGSYRFAVPAVPR